MPILVSPSSDQISIEPLGLMSMTRKDLARTKQYGGGFADGQGTRLLGP